MKTQVHLLHGKPGGNEEMQWNKNLMLRYTVEVIKVE